MSPLQGQRVAVTGGAGFLGSYVVEALRRRGVADVFVPRSAQYDLVSAEATQRFFADARPDVVVHLAAVVGGIGANRNNPGSFFYKNLMMGAHVIEEARRVSLKKLVLLGTVCAYPKFTPVPFREDDLWLGYPEETNAPYGIAKKALLVQAQAYRQQYGLDSVYLLPVNLYGPRDNFDPAASHVIPALIRKFLEARDSGSQVVEVWGDGTPTREFLFAGDAAEGIVRAAERPGTPEPINLGSGQEISIADLAALIARLVGYGGGIQWNASFPNGQPRRRLDTSRAERLLDFHASMPLEEGLRQTIAWYEAQRSPSRAR